MNPLIIPSVVAYSALILDGALILIGLFLGLHFLGIMTLVVGGIVISIVDFKFHNLKLDYAILIASTIIALFFFFVKGSEK